MKFSPREYPKRLLKIIKPKLILALAAVGVLVFLATRGGPDKSQIKTAEVTQKTIESQVTASGILKAENEVSLRFATSGKVDWIGVKQGDYVRRGQTIASLDAQELAKKLQKDLNIYFKTRLDFEDVKDSQASKVITDTLKRIAQRAQADLDNSVIEVEIRDLAIKFSKLSSPIDGIVLAKPAFFPQSNVSPSDIITTIADTNHLQFVAEVDETEIAQVSFDQKTDITLEAFPNEQIQVTVNSIVPKAITTSTGATVFEVIFNMPPQEGLRLGMNGEARIITKEIKNAFVIPIGAVVDEKFVWVKENSDYQKREITKGFEADAEIEVTAGLTKGEEVVMVGFDQIGKKNFIQKVLEKIR